VTCGSDVKFVRPLGPGALWVLVLFYCATLPDAPEWLVQLAAALRHKYDIPE